MSSYSHHPAIIFPIAGKNTAFNAKLSTGPNPVIWITFHIPYPQKVALTVYDLLGQKVATLASGYQMPGTRTYFWNAINTSSGTYFIQLEAEKDTRACKVVVLR